MSQHYGALLTALGEAKITAAIAHHAQIQLTHLAVGDGDGQLPPLHSAQTTLVHEQYRVALSSLTIDPDNRSHLIAEAILREEVGGWWIREIGLFDEHGELCAVANCPETYKPKLEEGAGRTQVIRLVLIVSSATAVALTIDPAVVLATRKELVDVLNQHVSEPDPHHQYLTRIDPVLQGHPTTPTPQPFSKDSSIATTEFVQTALENNSGVFFFDKRRNSSNQLVDNKYSENILSETEIELSEIHVGSFIIFWVDSKINIKLPTSVPKGSKFCIANHGASGASLEVGSNSIYSPAHAHNSGIFEMPAASHAEFIYCGQDTVLSYYFVINFLAQHNPLA
ncbi:phage tail protein [unidentified bacterial endosymbiont]|uniref:phage tail protein n=1 Tax=unidentified bacterial endosymbiont TaxID=2355 RepID=UPI00209EEE42|nr:phage tail protein [unidentified bacterial endosymbiont]